MEDSLPVRFDRPLTVVGDGVFDARALDQALALAPVMVAADGAADRLAAMGLAPVLAIGDMDSIGAPGIAAAGRLIELPEQDTTDFEKCLYATEAPLYLAVGFTGARLDHTLAVLHALLAWPEKRAVLIGESEVITLAPAGRALRVAVRPGSRVSVFPLRPLTASAEGLEWPLEGLTLAPGERIGTSNRAVAPEVTLRFDGPGAVVMLERDALASLAQAVGA